MDKKARDHFYLWINNRVHCPIGNRANNQYSGIYLLSVLMNKFCKFAIGFIIPSIIVALFNWGIDPDKIFHSDPIRETPTHAKKHNRMHTAIALEKFEPELIILGNSKARQIDPDHPSLSTINTYNASLPGINIYETFRYLQHANATTPLKKIIIGLDYIMFFKNPKPDFEESRLAVLPSGKKTPYMRKQLQLIKDKYHLLFSEQSLFNSIRAIYKTAPHSISSTKTLEITKEIFSRRSKILIKTALKDDNTKMNNSLNYLKNIVKIAGNNDIEIIIVFLPSHAISYEFLHSEGLWPKYEEWKREVFKIVQEESIKHSSTKQIHIWDFDGYNSINTENIPDLFDPNITMQYYRDSAHMKKNASSLILDCIMNVCATSIHNDFGLLIKDIDSHLLQLNNEKEIYRKNHPDEIRHLNNTIEQWLYVD
ncbi:MAG: hypothetical protein QF741_03265 [Candidatus Peribacteraceae bacterium]|nr:hypothetical protein [Candidatus Peribacteraceae bacterium]MDP7454085.1 hypothetical protein [Candidatus Peribacteraceae bacterium]